jgi:sugar lactone lactonase YvrE
MAQITVLDPSFERLIDRIATGFTFTEGPVWHGRDRYLIFSDIPDDTLYKWTEAEGCEVFRQPSGQSNGNTFDRRGRLITCGCLISAPMAPYGMGACAPNCATAVCRAAPMV